MAITKLNSLAIPSIDSSALPTGSLLNTYSSLNVTPSTLALPADTYTDVTGLSVTLTPTSASSKFIISARVFGESTAYDGHQMNIGLKRDSTIINAGTPSGSRGLVIANAGSDFSGNDQLSTPSTVSFTTIDSPATTSQITYKIYIVVGTGQTIYLNKTINDGDSNAYERGSSEIIVMEIK